MPRPHHHHHHHPIQGPELLDKYVGESEKAVRRVFERARSSAPCVIFFDELDALAPRRGSGQGASGGEGGGSGGVSERVVNQLLTELDGLETRRSVFVIAATNRPELIDPAMLRPGRLDKRLYVPLPCAADRFSILAACSRRSKVAASVDLAAVAADSRAEGFSGADLAALLREAGLAVLRALPRPSALDRHSQRQQAAAVTAAPGAGTAAAAAVPAAAGAAAGAEGVAPPLPEARASLEIGPEHFEEALARVRPSVSRADRVRYERMRDELEGR